MSPSYYAAGGTYLKDGKEKFTLVCPNKGLPYLTTDKMGVLRAHTSHHAHFYQIFQEDGGFRAVLIAEGHPELKNTVPAPKTVFIPSYTQLAQDLTKAWDKLQKDGDPWTPKPTPTNV
jgi:hypothetical protein